jgi:hypothetical protein
VPITDKLTPQTAKTNEEICSLEAENKKSGSFAIFVEADAVHLHQKGGESISIPKQNFDRLIDFYQHG